MKKTTRYSEPLLAVAAASHAAGVPFDIEAEHQKQIAKLNAVKREIRKAMILPLSAFALIIAVAAIALFAHR